MRVKIRQLIASLLCICPILTCRAQVADSLQYIVTLDSVTITAVRNGFSIADFIQYVEQDTSFYEAFRNLRRVNYQSRAVARMFDADYLTQASYTNIAKQFIEDRCRHLNFSYESSTGDFFDKHGDQNYYTPKLFSYIFLYRDTVCVTQGTTQTVEDLSKMEERKEQLKTLLFKPGQPVEDIPFLRQKLEIFSEEMMPQYDYRIESRRYSSGIDCYVFIIRKKESAAEGKDVVINELITWFDKKTMRIVSRQYSLSCYSPLFDFNVSMNVNLTTINGYQVPGFIQYNGYWDLPARKPERGSVQIFIW